MSGCGVVFPVMFLGFTFLFARQGRRSFCGFFLLLLELISRGHFVVGRGVDEFVEEEEEEEEEEEPDPPTYSQNT